MKFIKLSLAGTCIIFFSVGCNLNQRVQNNLPVSTVSVSCSQLSQTQILETLPQAANQMQFSPTAAYAPDNCHYAFSLYFLNPTADTTQTKSLLGTWVVDTKSHVAKQISNGTEYNNNFSKWLTNTQLQLNSANNDTVATYDLASGSIISKRVVSIMFRFTKLRDDVMATMKATSLSAPTTCSKVQQTNTGFLLLSYSCLQQSDVQLNIPAYGNYKVHYISPTSISINGKIYNISNEGYYQIVL